MKKLSIIWLVLAILFISLGFFHLNASRKSISLFQLDEKYAGVDVTSAGISIKDFVCEFNSYLDYYNESTRRQNRIAAFGYFLASVTVFVSMYLTYRRQN